MFLSALCIPSILVACVTQWVQHVGDVTYHGPVEWRVPWKKSARCKDQFVLFDMSFLLGCACSVWVRMLCLPSSLIKAGLTMSGETFIWDMHSTAQRGCSWDNLRRDGMACMVICQWANRVVKRTESRDSILRLRVCFSALTLTLARVAYGARASCPENSMST